MKQKMIIVLIVILAIVSCKKDDGAPTPETGSLIVFNGVIKGASVYNIRSISNAVQNVDNNSSSVLALLAGPNDLYFRTSSDSIHPYYAQSGFTIGAKEIYSLFLCGTTAAPEGILMKENFTPIKDSVLALRFVNLSPNSTPLNITLSTSTGVYEYSNIAYKQVTDFKMYPSLFNSSYTFQIRAANNPAVVLASYSYSATSYLPRFVYRTLVIGGLVGSSPSLGISEVYIGN